MKLRDIFDQLTAGELSQLHIGGSESGAIDEADWGKVVTHVNLGLTALYRRFRLKEGRLTLLLQPGLYSYALTSSYAVSNIGSAAPVKYLLDDDEPFKDHLLKVERVYTQGGLELGLNNLADPYALATPSSTTLRVPAEIVDQAVGLPDALKTPSLGIVFRANHPLLWQRGGVFDPDTLALELPYSHLQALLYFVASRVHNPVGMTNEFNAGNNWAAKYEQECQRLEHENLAIDQGSQGDRLGRNGWV